MNAVQDTAALAPATGAPIEAFFEPLGEIDVPAVLEVEQRAHGHPWTHGNFVDALKAGYQAQLLKAGDTLIGYFVAMKGVDEVHLLNITVAPDHQRQGWAAVMLEALAIWSRGQGARSLWLEVRDSNQRARAVYERHGFRLAGRRKAYYPATATQREDALVMSLQL